MKLLTGHSVKHPEKEFMEVAIGQAEQARKAGDYGIGAVIAKGGSVLVAVGNRVKIENIIICFGEPKYCLIAAREPLLAMETMPKTPDDAIPHLQAKVCKDWI